MTIKDIVVLTYHLLYDSVFLHWLYISNLEEKSGVRFRLWL